ncbi:MFS transporter [Synergistaceae bacterium OttesenSCG-928-I11]|nr:MFS transporter [Synergistaceae bacterium OttesenSCG-928-I11]
MLKPKITENDRLLISLFLPIYAIHCMEQIYFIYGTVVQGYGISQEMTGWVLGIFFIAIMSARPLGSWLLENFGIRRTLVGSSVLGLVGCLVLYFARGITMILLGRVLSGLSFGIYTIGIFSYQALIIPEAMRGATFAVVVSGGVLPTATITPLGEWLLIGGHLRLYLSLGPLMCVVCWYLGRRVGNAQTVSKDEKQPQWGSYGDLFVNRPFLVLTVTGMLVALVDATTASMSMYAAEYGVLTSYFLVSSSVAAVSVRLLGSKMLNRVPRALLFAPCGMLMAGALCCISLFPSNLTFLVAGALFGLGIGAGFPMYLSLISDTLPPALRPKGNATALFLYDSGWFLTPLVIGYASSFFGIAWTFRLLSLVSLGSLVALQILYWAPAYFRKKRL